MTGDNDIHVQLLDPATGALLLAAPHVIADTTAAEGNSSAAGWGLAGLAVALTGGETDGSYTQLVRTSAGDGADDLIIGDDAVDRMTGGPGDDTLSGLANADALAGGAGADRLHGGDGDDRLNGGPGNDTLDGGDGVDTADYSDGAAVDVNLGLAGFQNTGGGGHRPPGQLREPGRLERAPTA